MIELIAQPADPALNDLRSSCFRASGEQSGEARARVSSSLSVEKLRDKKIKKKKEEETVREAARV